MNILGTHVQTFVETAEGHPTVARLSVLVWPLPLEVVEGLAAHLTNTINAYLTPLGVTGGGLTDLHDPSGKVH